MFSTTNDVISLLLCLDLGIKMCLHWCSPCCLLLLGGEGDGVTQGGHVGREMNNGDVDILKKQVGLRI